MRKAEDDYFTVETRSLVTTLSVYVVLDCFLQYIIIWLTQRNGIFKKN
jgi:hypothetical protein